MKVLINEQDAKFLRGVIYSILDNVSMPREMRRKFLRIENKMSGSRAHWGINMKSKEVALMSTLVAASLTNLNNELASADVTQHRKDVLTEAAEIAKKVLTKLGDTLIQNQETASEN